MESLWRNIKTIAAVLMQAFGSTQEQSEDLQVVTDREIFDAVISENSETVERYLKKSSNINRLIHTKEQKIAPLHLACATGNQSIVEVFLRARVNVNLQDSRGASPLYFASQQGHQGIVDLLIREQADVNLQTSIGSSPLCIASHKGHKDVVDSLINAQADVNCQGIDGYSPIFRASQNGYQEIVDSLIKAQADINLQEDSGGTPIFIASKNGNSQIVDSLIKAQADVNLQLNTGETPILIASQNAHQQVIDSLIKAQADINIRQCKGGSPLYMASQHGHEKVVDSLIKAHADVNLQQNQGCSPLYIAAANGHQETLNLLIQAQADVNLQQSLGGSPLHIASQNGHHQVVNSLIKAQADVNLLEVDGCSPLYIASQWGHQQVVESLSNAQADVNLQRNTGESPLYTASQNGHLQVVESLIKAQADINLQQNQGCSSLYIASQNGHQEVVLSLIKGQADVSIQEKINGLSPLYIASHNGHKTVIDLLIMAQANLDLQQNQGCTPLFIAAQYGHQQVIESLINAQSDVNLQQYQGCTPLHIASQNGHRQVVESLIKAQADVNLQLRTGSTPVYIAAQNGHNEIVDSLIRAQADVGLQETDGCSPLYIASEKGHYQIVDSLITAQADVNLQHFDGSSPLYIASHNGHQTVVNSLIRAQADVSLRKHNGRSPLHIASQNDHQQVVRILIKAQADTICFSLSEMPSGCRELHSDVKEIGATLDDQELSQQLHSELNQSGFVNSRAALQSAVADVLQDILRKRQDYDERFIVGSYSEGWGNSLKTLDGRTDIESDIDVMGLVQGKLYHPRGLCECDGAPIQHEMSNGHIQCPGFTSNPAKPSPGFSLRPALDNVSAGRLCCYPPIVPLQPNRVSSANTRKSVLEALRQVVTSVTSPCHVVHAASPGRGGHELRVSTSFLEKRMLRSLTTLQGQLFVTLKYLIKKVICHKDGFNEQGLKPYHVKTITFRMVEETPVEQWKPENLVSLTRRSLQMLLDCVKSSRTPDNIHGRIMEHFFLSDVAVYLKGVGQKNSSETLSSIASTLRTVMDQLPQLLMKFMSSLRPVSESGRFYFHPFQIMPDLSPRPLVESSSLEYHEIYDVVRECLLRLSHSDCSMQSQESLTELIARLPDCALSAREALRALACLKFGYRSTAERIVSQCRGHSVSRGIDWSAERSATEATAEFVWRHLQSQDTAWKFCFEFDRRPKLSFLSAVLNYCFPLHLSCYTAFFYVNFEALVWALRLELQTESDAQALDWIGSVARREDADEQELMVAALFSSATENSLILKKLKNMSCLPDWLKAEIQLAYFPEALGP